MEEGSLPRLVLQPPDLGAVWTRFDAGPLGLGEQPGGERSDPRRFGRIGGWKARYRRAAVVVESRADLFGGADGAVREVEQAREEIRATARRVAEPALGAEAHAGVLAQGPLRVHVVVWRDANVVATIVANGAATQFSLDDALALARKQQQRIAAASD